MSLLEAAKEWGGERFDAFSGALDRRIDNEVSGDPVSYPSQGKDDSPSVKTYDDERGVSKRAGTGSQMVTGVPNTVLIVGGLGLAGLVMWGILR